MGYEKTVNEWRSSVLPALEGKAEEFQEMGYSRATSDDVWDCLMTKVWKGNPTKRIHEIVQDIFHLGSDIYISYLTLDAYRENDDLRASIDALTAESDHRT